MSLNRDLITFPTTRVVDKNMKGLSNQSFVPLADVPDMVWKVGPHKRGGMKSPEHPNHFADMDQKRPADGKTLLDLCEEDLDANVSVAAWRQYYDDVRDESRGLLPFRAWQIWDEMVDAATKKDIDRFVCAAGILAHYVGDSCQPLHISYRFNGDPDRLVPTPVKDPNTKETVEKQMPIGGGVHRAYEDGMVNYNIDKINTGLATGAAAGTDLPSIASGHDAAKAVVTLMRRTFDAIKPLDIVNAYIPLKAQGLTPKLTAAVLWGKFGDATIEIMRDGSQFLALIWQTAWDAGNGDRIGPARQLSQDDMIALYTNESFLPSHTIDTIGPILEGGSGEAAAAPSPRRPSPRPPSRRPPRRPGA